jgi:AcrR family transcriptional regulator
MRSTDDGRAGQKARTRAALLEAARQLMAQGALVSVTSVADVAGISRATAYRYFSDPQTLTIEALLDSRMKSTAAILGDCTEPRERVQRVRRFLFQLTRDSEAQFRQFLARTMERWLDDEGRSVEMIRGGRRLPMYREALAPAADGLDADALERLVLMLAATSGMESYVALKDVCRLDDAAADATAEAVTDAILDGFLPRSD